MKGKSMFKLLAFLLKAYISQKNRRLFHSTISTRDKKKEYMAQILVKFKRSIARF